MHMLRALFDGLRLRCPRCRQGHMFVRGFQITSTCPECGLIFEHASGEMTGGMGINISVTLLPIMIAAFALGLNPAVPLGPLLAGLMLFAIVFPIAFYRSARGIWVAVIYLTGDANERD